MGRIKELLEKRKAGTITGDEETELKELQTEAEEAKVDAGGGQAGEDEEKAIDELANKLADTAMSRLEKGLEKVVKSLEDKASNSDVRVTKEASMIFDKSLGKKVAVEELENIKVALPNRDGKKHKEISGKSAHFVQAWLTGDVQKLQVLVEGTGARGGFLVPDDYANVLVEDIRDRSIMRQIADVITTTSDTLHIPNLASRPRAAFRSEGAVKNTSTVDFGETVLTPYSIASIVPLSNELVADASLGVNGSIVNLVTQYIAQAIAEREEKAFWVGNGSGQPTGIDNYTFRTVTASPTDAARADAFIQAWARTPQGYRNRGVFVMNSGTIEKALTLKDTQGNYLLKRLGESPQLTLLGRPVYEQNDLGGGKAFFGDFSYYKIVDREGISVLTSQEATVASQSAFERNLTFVRVEKRVDAELTLTDPITELAGLGTP